MSIMPWVGYSADHRPRKMDLGDDLVTTSWCGRVWTICSEGLCFPLLHCRRVCACASFERTEAEGTWDPIWKMEIKIRRDQNTRVTITTQTIPPTRTLACNPRQWLFLTVYQQLFWWKTYVFNGALRLRIPALMWRQKSSCKSRLNPSQLTHTVFL